MRKAQSAMEYLMTYGWSILIVAVVLAVLFSLGVFNANSGGGTSACIALSGWQCTKLLLYSSGALSLNIGVIGQPITITGVGCSSNSTSPSSYQNATASQNSGQTASYTTGCPLTSSALGSSFSGRIWVHYYYNSNPSMRYSVVVANLKTTVLASGIPGGYAAYVPITLTNSQSSATGSGFQQMISFNPNSLTAYTTNEAANLGNIRFYQGGQELASWCESGCNAITSSNAVFWVNIPAGIPGSSSITINMDFLSNTVQYDGVYAGENPAQSTTYGQYDNGGNVFAFYQNGASAVSWTKSGSAGTTTSAASGSPFGTNAFVALGANNNFEYINTGLSTTGNYIIQYYIYSSELGDIFFMVNPTGQGVMSRIDTRGAANSGLAYTPGYGTGGWNSPNPANPMLNPSTWYLFQIFSLGGTQVGDSYGTTLSYGASTTTLDPLGTTFTDSAGTETYSLNINGAYLGLEGDGAGGATYLNGLSARVYPPGGVMPSVSFGSITH
jgi:hypothetical protein